MLVKLIPLQIDKSLVCQGFRHASNVIYLLRHEEKVLHPLLCHSAVQHRPGDRVLRGPARFTTSTLATPPLAPPLESVEAGVDPLRDDDDTELRPDPEALACLEDLGHLPLEDEV